MGYKGTGTLPAGGMPILFKARVIALAIVMPFVFLAVWFINNKQTETNTVLDALWEETKVFDATALSSGALYYTDVDTDKTDGTLNSETTGWWNPQTGAAQSVTTRDLTTFIICEPATTNAAPPVESNSCYVKHYNPQDGTATGWYASNRVYIPFTIPLYDGLNASGVPAPSETITVTIDTETVNGTHTINVGNTQRSVTVTSETAEITSDDAGFSSKLNIIATPTPAEPYDTGNIVVDGSRTEYTQTMTSVEAAELAEAITAAPNPTTG